MRVGWAECVPIWAQVAVELKRGVVGHLKGNADTIGKWALL